MADTPEMPDWLPDSARPLWLERQQYTSLSILAPRAEPLPSVANPYRLISLGEIVKTIKAGGLVEHGYFLMLFRAPGMHADKLARPERADEKISEGDRNWGLECLRVLQQDCEGLGLSMTLAKVNRLMATLPNLSYKEMEAQCKELYERLNDELGSQLFFQVDTRHLPFYQYFGQGWEAVFSQFPTTAFDVEEASKCFALNRYTATAFHLMRVMEIGLRVLADTLHDERLDPKRNPTWDRILQRCRDEQSKPLAERSPEWRANEAFFSGVSARLMAVKDAWRNPTMHIERTYTEEMSLDVLTHVQAFMRHLATELSES